MTLTATCHCGATRIEVPDLPMQAKECNCSYCARTGAVWGYYAPDAMRFVSATDEKTYSASDGMNQHHFCGRCGMQTWGDSPDWASMYNNDGTPKNGDPHAMPTERVFAIKLRLIDELDWSALAVEKVDGRASW